MRNTHAALLRSWLEMRWAPRAPVENRTVSVTLGAPMLVPRWPRTVYTTPATPTGTYPGVGTGVPTYPGGAGVV